MDSATTLLLLVLAGRANDAAALLDRVSGFVDTHAALKEAIARASGGGDPVFAAVLSEARVALKRLEDALGRFRTPVQGA